MSGQRAPGRLLGIVRLRDAVGRILKSWEQRPKARARTYAAFLAAHLLLTVPMAVVAASWDGSVPGGWLAPFNFDTEGTAANLYSGVLWLAVAALGLAQLSRSVPTQRPRWRWTTGWACVGVFAALVAFEELAGLKDTDAAVQAVEYLTSFAPGWLPKDARWLAVIAPLAAPLAAAAGWALYTSQRPHPVRAFLTVLSVGLLLGVLIIDGLDPFYDWPTRVWIRFIEEGSELLASALLVVILTETLLNRTRSIHTGRLLSVGPAGRRAAVGVSLALLAASAPALLGHHEWDDEELVHPDFYSGPVALVTQTFQANQDNMMRIGTWAFAEGGAVAQVFARLRREGEDKPIRESRTEVAGNRGAPEAINFSFEPVPHSKGQRYSLDIGILGGPTPHVFLGLTGGDSKPDGKLTINGVPSRYANWLAMHTGARVRGIPLLREMLERAPQRLWLIAGVALVVALWVVAVAAAWGGLSGDRPRFRREVVWDAARIVCLVTIGVAALGIALLPIVADR